jgi:hypothetical protein
MAVPRLKVMASATAGTRPKTDFNAESMLFNVVTFSCGCMVFMRTLFILPATTDGRAMDASFRQSF